MTPIQITVLCAAGVVVDEIDQQIQHLLGPHIQVDLGGSETVLRDHFETENVFHLGFDAVFHHFNHQLGRNKQHAAAAAIDNITRQTHCRMLSLPKTHRTVKAEKTEIPDRRGVNPPVIHIDAVDLFHLLNVTYTAPDHGAAGMGTGFDGGGQVAAEEGALIDLVIHVDNSNIPVTQRIDHPLVGGPGHPFRLGQRAGICRQIRPRRRISGSDSAADHFTVERAVLPELRMKTGHSHKLVLIALNKNRLPQLLQRHLADLVQIGIGDFRPAVGKTLALPL